ncbi:MULTISPECIES: hypothetical protein [unclassified Streptomyces]|uniref:hypothetical protein n=1 Tax=unclassified Streptomyces TaxID=2593676 RepID=UPI002E0F775A|nr:hypothetical protein OG452_13285 [Streptomyces sp. NBC_01197]WSS51078.1 hypothetical protein OG708_22080 [Streptomyces sp. NBC_01180]
MGARPGSFGWVFPKGDVCTAGVVAARGNPVALRAYKEDFPSSDVRVSPVPRTALTRLPPAWRLLDAYLAGRTSVAGIMPTPLTRTATALALRLPLGPARKLSGEAHRP